MSTRDTAVNKIDKNLSPLEASIQVIQLILLGAYMQPIFLGIGIAVLA